jgi:zinc and cadmium transporter
MPGPNTTQLLYAIASVTIVTAASLGGAVTFTLKRSDTGGVLPYLISLAAGALLGTASAHFLPEAVDRLGTGTALTIPFLAGFVLFFLFEKLISVFYAPAGDLGSGDRPHLLLNVLSGGAIHSFIDGIAVATAYLSNTKLGMVTTLAVILHEVPHHIGDMGILLYCGLGRRKALLLNLLATAASIVGVVLVLLVGTNGIIANSLIPFATANFIYIATANLMPELQAERTPYRSALQVSCIAIGALTMVLLRNI